MGSEIYAIIKGNETKDPLMPEKQELRFALTSAETQRMINSLAKAGGVVLETQHYEITIVNEGR